MAVNDGREISPSGELSAKAYSPPSKDSPSAIAAETASGDYCPADPKGHEFDQAGYCVDCDWPREQP